MVLSKILRNAGKVESEEDVKNKIVVPFLQELDWKREEINFPAFKRVVVGSREARVAPDILVKTNGTSVMVVETKGPYATLTREHEAQSDSYALLYESPPIPFSVLSNGKDWLAHNIYTDARMGLDGIPSRTQFLRGFVRPSRMFSPALLEHHRRVLITIHHKDDLMKIFSKCAQILKKSEGLISDPAFDEISKLLTCKLNEERRVKEGAGPNRFATSLLTEVGFLNGMREIFTKVKEDFRTPMGAVFEDQDDIKIESNTIRAIVELLEPFDLYGTGEDIKGAVYESFLSGTLRGELGQYFTPREIVEFIVELSAPSVGEQIIDPCIGSGGLIIQSFLRMHKAIATEPGMTQAQKDGLQKKLIDECLWGIDISPRLVKLCKLNLMIHGDGYNHIYRSDALMPYPEVTENTFDLVITNPPFNLPTLTAEIIQPYTFAAGKESIGSDVLFLERCINLAKPGGRIAIVLPWGILNLPTYSFVRKKLFEECILRAVISLPEGAFIPFGQSHAKTCILYCQKRNSNKKQGPYFVAIANHIGYDHRRKYYKKIPENDLPSILGKYRQFLEEHG